MNPFTAIRDVFSMGNGLRRIWNVVCSVLGLSLIPGLFLHETPTRVLGRFASWLGWSGGDDAMRAVRTWLFASHRNDVAAVVAVALLLLIWRSSREALKAPIENLRLHRGEVDDEAWRKLSDSCGDVLVNGASSAWFLYAVLIECHLGGLVAVILLAGVVLTSIWLFNDEFSIGRDTNFLYSYLIMALFALVYEVSSLVGISFRQDDSS